MTVDDENQHWAAVTLAPQSISCTPPAICAVAAALPPHYVEQAALTAALRELWAERNGDARLFDRIQRSLGITGRYLPLPIDDYRRLNSFAQCNDAWLRLAPELAETAARTALARAGLQPRDIDHLFFVTVTGIATPSVDALLVNRLGMLREIKRTPIFGLGCAAGAAALGRAADHLRAFPYATAMVVSVELCSLTLQRGDRSIANIVASGLFGDGAAAAILSGANRPGCMGPRVIASRSILYPNTERVLGWELVESGFKIVLSAQLSELVRDHLRADVDAFLAEHSLLRPDIAHWVVHAGGPRILAAVQQALELPDRALDTSWRSLRRAGNLSSASVLFILEDLTARNCAEQGELGLMLAMGPGFGVEMVLLRW
jgi:alkylresorcinol/alkylpyrone synthase